MAAGSPATGVQPAPPVLDAVQIAVLHAAERSQARWMWTPIPGNDNFAFEARLEMKDHAGNWISAEHTGRQLVRDGFLAPPVTVRSSAVWLANKKYIDPALIPDYSPSNIRYDRGLSYDCNNASHTACPGWRIAVTVPRPGRPETRKPNERLFCPCRCGHAAAVRRIENYGRDVAPGLTAEQTIAAFPAQEVAR